MYIYVYICTYIHIYFVYMYTCICIRVIGRNMSTQLALNTERIRFIVYSPPFIYSRLRATISYKRSTAPTG